MAAAIPIAAAVAGPLINKMLNPGSGNQPAPAATPTASPVEAGQISKSATALQGNLNGQQALLEALAGQGGVNKQSDVYNQTQGVVNGTGPNPAQAMLANATGKNVANQASLMAGQRGASQNAGLIARQAAQQGGNLQQQAAGQGAAMQAQQSLAALGQLGTQANQMTGQQIGQVNQNTNSQMANNQNLMNAQQGHNANAVASQNNVNTTNQAMNLQQQQQQANMAGNLTSAIGTALTLPKDKAPPIVPESTSEPTTAEQLPQGQALAAEGGAVGPGMPQQPQDSMPVLGHLMQAEASMPVQPITASPANSVPVQSGAPQYGNIVQHMMAKGGSIRMAVGGQVPALVSPGEKYLPPQAVQQVAQGASPMEVGKTIPGKPKVKGAKNSYANDTVPATLEEGGIVLPRSVTQSKNPQWAAHKFVSAILAKQGKGFK